MHDYFYFGICEVTCLTNFVTNLYLQTLTQTKVNASQWWTIAHILGMSTKDCVDRVFKQ